MSEDSSPLRRGWQGEVDGLLRVLLTSRNESVMVAQRQVDQLRSALKRMEHRLDDYDSRSTTTHQPAQTDTGGKPRPIREPMSQQRQQVGDEVY